jgi:aspartyl-tRNA(Asn)/glutamyl-tRNA(Gln) amidotransferase subunit B
LGAGKEPGIVHGAYNRFLPETTLPIVGIRENPREAGHRDAATGRPSHFAASLLTLMPSSTATQTSSPAYTVVVGLEVHAQLRTRTKLFCGCTTEFRPDAPNTQTCPVCLGLPGSLPVMNREAFRLALTTAMALNCQIAELTRWDRKQYYYPDLPKAYQISQYDQPFSSRGWIDIPASDAADPPRRIRITRAHLEEDAGRNLHDESGRGADSRVDLNRAGTPLLEIVSEPDLRSAAEARRCLESLHQLLLFLGVSDCNMQEGSLRCDANVNLHIPQPDGHHIATPIVELKNMNSFRNVELAVEYEARRQYQQWQKTQQRLGDLPKQTRGWDAERSITFSQREKEESSDYRYFPDPDLQPVHTSVAELEALRSTLPEPPAARRNRFCSVLGLSAYDADVILDQGPELTQWFEQVAALCNDPKTAANWVTQDILRDLKATGTPLNQFPITATILGTLLACVTAGRITTKSGREVYATLREAAAAGAVLQPADVERIISERKLEIVRDTAALDAAIATAIAARPEAVRDYRAGKGNALGPLIGMIMKHAAGADPRQVRERLISAVEAGN